MASKQKTEIDLRLKLVSDGDWYEIRYVEPDCGNYRLLFHKRIDDPADIAQRVGEEIMSWLFEEERKK